MLQSPLTRKLTKGAPKPLAWLLVLFGALVVASFWPGFMSSASYEQYTQGLKGTYDNLHPQVYSWLLGISGHLTRGPGLVMLLQVVLLFAGWSTLVRRASPLAAVLLCAVTLALPPVWVLAATVWKDVFFAVVLVLGVAAWLEGAHRGWLALSIVVAAMVRYNAVFALAPFVFAFAWEVTQRRLGRLVLSMAGVVVLAVVPVAISAMSGAQDRWPGGKLVIFALGSVSQRAHEAPPGYEALLTRHSDDSVTPLIAVPAGQPWSVDYLAANREALVRDAVGQVARYPVEYLRGRLSTFSALMGIGREKACEPFHPGIDQSGLGIEFSPRTEPARAVLLGVRSWAADSFLFRGWFWVALCSVLFVVGLARRRPKVMLVTASGLMYATSFFVFAPSCDFRFLYWPVLATLMALVHLVAAPPPPREPSLFRR